MGNLVRFTFPDGSDPEAIEQDVALSLLVAEFIHGKSRLRLEASYDVNPGTGACALRMAGPAGETAALVFAGFCAARFGEEGYHVKRYQGGRALVAPGKETR